MVRFIHTSDLHLGCMPANIIERYNDFFDAFRSVILYANENQIKYLLISGDLFHLKVINSKTLLSVTEELEFAKSNGIKIIVIEGNHDKAFYVDQDSWLIYLQKRQYITLLKHKVIDGHLVLTEDSFYEDEDIRIIGIGYLGSATSRYISDLKNIIPPSTKPTVLMLHAAVNRLNGEDMGDVSIKLIEKLKENVDYVAMGHIHVKYEYDNFCFNPGSLESIRLKDAKRVEDKGFFDVKLDKGKVDAKYVNSKCRKAQFVTIDVSGIPNPRDVIDKILKEEINLGKKEMLELNIIGTVSFNPYLIDIEELKTKMMEKYDLLYIEINNLLNLVSSDYEIDEKIDLKTIEKNIILQNLKNNYPDATDIDLLANKMMNVKEKLQEEIEEDLIIDYLLANEE